MKIRWIGQNGYILEDEKTQIIIDPYLSDAVNGSGDYPRMVEAPIRPEDVVADYVICTHDHADHIDPDAIVRMNLNEMHFIAPSWCEERLKGLGCKKIIPLDIGESVSVGNFKITAVFANHTIDAIGIVVEYNSLKLYFTGDTLYHTKLEAMKDWGIAAMFICINGKLGNMNVDEAVKLTKIIKPKVGIPTHYGMFAKNTEDPIKYTSQVDNGFTMEFNKEYDILDILKSVE